MKINMEKLPYLTKKNIIIVIMIISIISISFLINGQEVIIIRSDKSVATVRAGETVNFSLIFEYEGGFFDEHYEMVDIEIIGDWDVNFKGTSIYIPANSKKELMFTLHVPDNAEDGDWYYYKFGLVPRPIETGYELQTFTINVNNSIPIEIPEGGGFHRTVGSTFQLPPLVIIPTIIIIICGLFWLKLSGYFEQRKTI